MMISSGRMFVKNRWESLQTFYDPSTHIFRSFLTTLRCDVVAKRRRRMIMLLGCWYELWMLISPFNLVCRRFASVSAEKRTQSWSLRLFVYLHAIEPTKVTQIKVSLVTLTDEHIKIFHMLSQPLRAFLRDGTSRTRWREFFNVKNSVYNLNSTMIYIFIGDLEISWRSFDLAFASASRFSSFCVCCFVM